MNTRLMVVFILGFSSGLPLALISSTLQAWFAKAGMPLMTTGALSLLSLPYAYRFLWGPVLDRYSLLSLGKRRSWILLMQAFLVVGFNVLACFSPATSPTVMVIIGFILACFSSTLDVAIDAHRTEYLPINEHALGASLAVLGYRLALLMAGGVALILASRLGWAMVYRVMSGFFLVGMVATYLSPEPSLPISPPASFTDTFRESIKSLLLKPGFFVLLCFIFFYKLGEAFTTTTSGIVMPFLIQGVGFSLNTIAYINKVMGIAAILAGGLVAGFLLMRCSLFSTLLVFGVLQAIANSFFIALALVGKSILLFASAVMVDNLAAGMGSTALVAFFMRLVDKRYTATQFSVLVAFSMLPRVMSGPCAALLQSWFGWVGLYQLSCVFALFFIPFLMLLRKKIHIDAVLNN